MRYGGQVVRWSGCQVVRWPGGQVVRVVRVVSRDDMLSENIWFSCPKSSNDWEKLRCHTCDWLTNGKWKVVQYSVWAESANIFDKYLSLSEYLPPFPSPWSFFFLHCTSSPWQKNIYFPSQSCFTRYHGASNSDAANRRWLINLREEEAIIALGWTTIRLHNKRNGCLNEPGIIRRTADKNTKENVD